MCRTCSSWRQAATLAAAMGLGLVLSGCGTASAKSSVEILTTLDAGQLQAVLNEAHAKLKDVEDGKNADYIPILATIPSELSGVAIATRDGKLYTAGDVDYRFAIEEVFQWAVEGKGYTNIAGTERVAYSGYGFHSFRSCSERGKGRRSRGYCD